MSILKATAVLAAGLALCGCVTTHEETAALKMPWPGPQSAALAAYAAPRADYPTVGGDILKGTAPAPETPLEPLPPEQQAGHGQ